MLLLSTDSDKDLSLANSEFVNFTRELPGLSEESFLKYPNRWLVEAQDGCSCGFRHLYIDSVELGFSEPEDWFPEDKEDIQATLEFIKVIRELIGQKSQIDCIDVWDNQNNECCIQGRLDVNLSTLNDTQFRFFEAYHFVFRAEC